MPPLVAITPAIDRRRRPTTMIGLLFIPLALASSPVYADPPGSLVVRVLDRAKNSSVAGASVVVNRRGVPRDRATDADGRVTLDELAAGECAVTVRAAGFARAVHAVVIKPGAAAEAEVQLDPGGSLAGVIRDPDGRPIAGVGLSASPWSGVRVMKYDAREAVTDDEGRYRLDHLAVNTPLMIDVILRDYLDGESVVNLVPGVQEFDLTLQPQPNAGAANGVVVDPQGRPVADATVLNRRHDSVEHRQVRTGPDGRFAFPRIYEDKSAGPNVLVVARGFAPRRVPIAPAVPGRSAEVRVPLEVGHKLAGRVVDAARRPVADVRVFAGNEILGDFDPGQRTTTVDGRFEFDDLPDPATIPTRFDLHHPGFSRLHKQKFPLDAAAPVEVVLAPRAEILGRAVDARTGRPVARFTVRVGFTPFRDDGDPPNILEVTRMVDPGLTFEAADGQFRLANLADRLPLQVTVAAPGYEATTHDRVVAVPAGLARVDEFLLVPVAADQLETYAGRLRDPGGAPLAGVQVRLIAVERFEPDDERRVRADWYSIRNGDLAGRARVARFVKAVTGPDGRFSFAAIPRFHDVTLAWWGDQVATDWLDDLGQAPPGRKADLDLTLAPPSRIVVAVDRGRHPAASMVAIRRDHDNSWGLVPSPAPLGEADLTVANLPAGRYDLELLAPAKPGEPRTRGIGKGLATTTIHLKAGETARVDFAQGK